MRHSYGLTLSISIVPSPTRKKREAVRNKSRGAMRISYLAAISRQSNRFQRFNQLPSRVTRCPSSAFARLFFFCPAPPPTTFTSSCSFLPPSCARHAHQTLHDPRGMNPAPRDLVPKGGGGGLDAGGRHQHAASRPPAVTPSAHAPDR